MKLQNLSIGILSWKRRDVLEQTLKNYKKVGLLDRVDDITIFFNEMSPKDVALAKKYKIKYIGNPKNIGIQKAVVALLQAAKNKYFLFLENDWVVIEKTDVMVKRLQASIQLLQTQGADVVRLRHTITPGYPCWTVINANGNAANLTNNNLIGSLSVGADPCALYDSETVSKKILDGENYYIFHSKNAGWTNNPCLYETNFGLNLLNTNFDRNKNINLTEYAKEKETSIDLVSLEADISKTWIENDFKVASGIGIFSHMDYVNSIGRRTKKTFKKIRHFVFNKVRQDNGQRRIYLFGINVFRYTR